MLNWLWFDLQMPNEAVLSFCTLHFALCTELVPEVGIAPTVLADCQVLLFREVLICLSYSGRWSSRQVTLLRLPVINRVLCY